MLSSSASTSVVGRAVFHNDDDDANAAAVGVLRCIKEWVLDGSIKAIMAIPTNFELITWPHNIMFEIYNNNELIE